MHRKTLDSGIAGDNVGVLLRGVGRDDIERGQVLAKARFNQSLTQALKASVYILKKEEGGRHSAFFAGYRPQFYFRTTDVTGICNTALMVLKWLCLGIMLNSDVELIKPIAMEEGSPFCNP